MEDIKIEIAGIVFNAYRYGSISYFESEEHSVFAIIEDGLYQHLEKSPLDYRNRPLPYSNVIYETDLLSEFEEYLKKHIEFRETYCGTGGLAFRVDKHLFFYDAGTPYNYDYGIYAGMFSNSDSKSGWSYQVYEKFPYTYKYKSTPNNNILFYTHSYEEFRMFILGIMRNKKIERLY